MAKNSAKTKSTVKRPDATFEVRFVDRDLKPERIPLHTVNEVLSAVQDLASGRDPFETRHVPPEKSIGLLRIRRGSAIYDCVARSPREALHNLGNVGNMLSGDAEDDDAADGNGLVAALRPIQALSDVTRSVGCRVEVNRIVGKKREPLFSVGQDDFERISSRLLLSGDATVIGEVERVGGATGMRCLLRVSGRRKLLYCDVDNRELARRLGEHLYEEIAATGTAVWIHSTWRIYEFKIREFSQPRLGDDPLEAIGDLRKAGLKAWDTIDNPEEYIRDLRS